MTFIHSWGCNFTGNCYPQNPRTLVPNKQYWLHSKWLKIIMRINNKYRNRITMIIKNEEIEEINTFCYLWSVINNNGESKEVINIRISKSALKKIKIWKLIKISRKKTNIKLYKSNTRYVLTFAAETYVENI